MKKHALLLHPQTLAILVRDGVKKQTFRKREPKYKIGDIIKIRCWGGRPYHAKQKHICFVRVTKISPAKICANGVSKIDGNVTYQLNTGIFASREGFETWEEFFQYIKKYAAKEIRDGVVHGYLTEWEIE